MAGARTRILEPGVSCWRVAPADRIAVLIDAAGYFQVLLHAMRRARSRIVIVGWDFDPRVRLDPNDPATELRVLLPGLAERSPDLHVHLLIWDVSLLFGPSGTFDQLAESLWPNHPRVNLRFDSEHPVGAAHHEKIVTIDDALAFVGGIDLTVKRWDTPAHAVDEALRRDPDGAPYEPVHDLQMAIDGEAARTVAALARERWADATGETLAPCAGPGDPWPDSLTPALTRMAVGIARTRPTQAGRAAVTEIAALNVAALAAARRSVYIENQYLAAAPIADRLALLLERPEGPEIVLVVWHQATGWLERFAMGSNRERLLRRLAAADRHGRLRAYWLRAPGGPGPEINLHAKLMIVDDVYLRIGSSNLNNRSLGYDTECDLAIEATDEATRNQIAGVRDRLLAEHLARPQDEVARAVAETGLIGAIERLNQGAGRFQPYRIEADSGPKEPFPGSALLDPAEPLDLDYLRRWLQHVLVAD